MSIILRGWELASSNQIVRFMGQGGLKTTAKVFSLLLAAIAVSMIINGLDLAGIISIAG